MSGRLAPGIARDYFLKSESRLQHIPESWRFFQFSTRPEIFAPATSQELKGRRLSTILKNFLMACPYHLKNHRDKTMPLRKIETPPIAKAMPNIRECFSLALALIKTPIINKTAPSKKEKNSINLK